MERQPLVSRAARCSSSTRSTQAQPRAYLALSGALEDDDTPIQWTIQPYDYKPTIIGAGGIAQGDDREVFNDNDKDNESDTPFDATLSQQWDAQLDVRAERGHPPHGYALRRREPGAERG